MELIQISDFHKGFFAFFKKYVLSKQFKQLYFYIFGFLVIGCLLIPVLVTYLFENSVHIPSLIIILKVCALILLLIIVSIPMFLFVRFDRNKNNTVMFLEEKIVVKKLDCILYEIPSEEIRFISVFNKGDISIHHKNRKFHGSTYISFAGSIETYSKIKILYPKVYVMFKD